MTAPGVLAVMDSLARRALHNERTLGASHAYAGEQMAAGYVVCRVKRDRHGRAKTLWYAAPDALTVRWCADQRISRAALARAGGDAP